MEIADKDLPERSRHREFTPIGPSTPLPSPPPKSVKARHKPWILVSTGEYQNLPYRVQLGAPQTKKRYSDKKGDAFTKGIATFITEILWRELPSQKRVFVRAFTDKRDLVKGYAFTKGILWRELPSQKDFVKRAAFTKWILWRELPSQKRFREESWLHKIDFFQGSCLHKREFVKRATFTKGILWRELRSQKGLVQELLCSDRYSFCYLSLGDKCALPNFFLKRLAASSTLYIFTSYSPALCSRATLVAFQAMLGYPLALFQATLSMLHEVSPHAKLYPAFFPSPMLR
jgi:hypothetical protein